MELGRESALVRVEAGRDRATTKGDGQVGHSGVVERVSSFVLFEQAHQPARRHLLVIHSPFLWH